MSAWPATLETIPFSAAAAGLTALSKAKGPSTRAASDLSAVGHLAQRRGVEGRAQLRIDGFDRRQQRHARRFNPHHMRQIDRVLHDVALLFEVGGDVHRRVGHQ